jgi:hypothetical protein
VISARFVSLLSEGIAAKKGSIGHLKLLTVGEAGSVKVGVTHAGEMPSLDGAFTGPLSHCEVTVNIRATLSPGDLASIVLAAVERFGESVNAECEVSAVNTFRPGAPNPTYRYNE